MKPRDKNAYGQMLVYGTTLSLAKTIGAPLERLRIIMQTKDIPNLKPRERPTGTSANLIQSKDECSKVGM